MQPRKIAKAAQAQSEGQTSPPRQPERKRRFQIIKLEERIAPGANNSHGRPCGGGHTADCR
jgi:hypothetical protein